MNLTLLLLGCFLALALGLPNGIIQVDEPHAAYQKDIAILPPDDGNSRIVNGKPAERDQFPYQVSIHWGWLETPAHVCGGSIIGPSVVLTAGHCIDDYGTHSVVAGILNRDEVTTNTQNRDVVDIKVHPKFPGGAVLAPNDVAVLITSKPFTWTASVKPVKIPQPGQEFTGKVVLSGWGRTWYGGPTSVALQWAETSLISYLVCSFELMSILGHTGSLDQTMVCTTGYYDVAACNGDSGSPLVKDGIVVGIVSWGVSPCGTMGAPSVFTSTAYFSNWIQQHL